MVADDGARKLGWPARRPASSSTRHPARGFYCPFTPTPTYTQALFRNIDINESGELDYTEFLGAGLQARHVTKPSIKAAFAILDRNGDGFITKVQRQRRQDGGEPGARFFGRPPARHSGRGKRRRFARLHLDHA